MANPLLVRAGLKVAKKVGKKAIKKIKQRRNSTDNLKQGPMENAMKKKYREAEDAFIFHTGKNNPSHFVNPPKMSQNTAEKILSQVKRLKK